MLEFDWLKGRGCNGSHQDVQIWYQLPDMEETRADKCADNGKLSGLSVHASSMGENVVFHDIGYSIPSTAYTAQHT